jgi:putative transposase
MTGVLSFDELNIVFNHIIAGNGRFYLLISLVLMPDHGHIIFKSFPQYSLQRVMKGVKGVSSHLVNRLRGTTGTVWQDESYDRIVRNDDELYEKVQYMFFNPVKKELVVNPEEYPFWYYDDSWNEKIKKGGRG